jgi:hypothetical protein
MATATERLWRTADGQLVRDGDEAGQSLAYTPGDQIAPKDESLVPGDDQADAKAADKPENKMAAPPANKAAAKPGNK